MSSILIAEDNTEMRNVLMRSLKKMGHHVVVCSGGREALAAIKDSAGFDLLLSDIRMEDMNGMALLKQTLDVSPDTQVILMTAFGSVNDAVDAMKQGAVDYLLKPFAIKELELRIDRAIVQKKMAMENNHFKESIEQSKGEMLGSSIAIRRVRDAIAKVAPSPAHVLITGETGTGKELVARDIHHRSQRADGPFVAVNCVALASGVMESELFGHEKGSFTGAVNLRRGKFEIADGGTLFLDEIGELDDKAQVKLLRFVQEKDFERVGGNKKIKVDTRIVAATNRDLKEEMKKGHFREDLYYRLSMFTIETPPLRERPDDILLLTKHFLEKYMREIGKHVSLGEEVGQLLAHHRWPGNIRELQNVIGEAVILSDGDTLRPSCFPSLLSPEHEGFHYGADAQGNGAHGLIAEVKMLEKERIERALEDNNWNQTRTAEHLGLKRTSLQYKMKQFGLKKPPKEPHGSMSSNPAIFQAQSGDDH
jgi:DNA-binding NtrC family response regulator